MDGWKKTNEFIVKEIIEFLGMENSLSQEQLQKAEYAVKCILSEFEKIILLGILFTMFGKLHELVICMITIIFLRRYIGGSHRKTICGCFCQSLFSFLAIIFCANNYTVTESLQHIIICISIIGIWKYAPVISKNRPKYNEYQKTVFRCKALTVLLTLYILGDFLPVQEKNCMFMSILYQVCEMIIVAKIQNKGGVISWKQKKY